MDTGNSLIQMVVGTMAVGKMDKVGQVKHTVKMEPSHTKRKMEKYNINYDPLREKPINFETPSNPHSTNSPLLLPSIFTKHTNYIILQVQEVTP